jgi:ribosomal protein L44E
MRSGYIVRVDGSGVWKSMVQKRELKAELLRRGSAKSADPRKRSISGEKKKHKEWAHEKFNSWWKINMKCSGCKKDNSRYCERKGRVET